MIKVYFLFVFPVFQNVYCHLCYCLCLDLQAATVLNVAAHLLLGYL